MAGKIGIIGILIGFLALAIAIFQNDVRSYVLPESGQVSQNVLSKGVSLWSRSKMAEQHDVVDYSYMGLGLVVLVFAIASFVRKENIRISAVAAVLGIMAVAWQWVLVGIIIAVILLFLLALST